MNPEEKYDRDEFHWENSFREDDEYIASYIKLLKRFSDLPECNQLISRQLGDLSSSRNQNEEHDFPECSLNCNECSNRWHCDFAMPELSEEQSQWLPPEDDPIDSAPEDEPAAENGEGQPGDIFYYENAPSFVLLRQTALGWCNVYATVLPADDSFTGGKVLFYISRALTHLAASVGDGLYIQVGANIAFAKRALQDLNHAVGLINELSKNHAELESVSGTVRRQLLKVREMILTHLKERRQTKE